MSRKICGLKWTIPAIIISLWVLVTLVACNGGTSSGTAMPASTQNQQPNAISIQNTITVIGEGKINSSPDEAILTISVQNEGADPASTLDVNSTNTQKVMDRLKTEGLEDSNMETARVSIYPNYTYNPRTGKESIAGYRAENQITVTLKDPLKVGKVLAAAVEAGASNISGPEWRLSNDSAAITDALKKAVDNASTKANALAEAQGVKVGEVLMMSEGEVHVPVMPVYYEAARDTDNKAMALADVPILPANLDITAKVTVTYLLKR